VITGSVGSARGITPRPRRAWLGRCLPLQEVLLGLTVDAPSCRSAVTPVVGVSEAALVALVRAGGCVVVVGELHVGLSFGAAGELQTDTAPWRTDPGGAPDPARLREVDVSRALARADRWLRGHDDRWVAGAWLGRDGADRLLSLPLVRAWLAAMDGLLEVALREAAEAPEVVSLRIRAGLAPHPADPAMADYQRAYAAAELRARRQLASLHRNPRMLDF
jgi:hypothetical protein